METINCTSLTNSSDPAGSKGRLDGETLLIHQILAGQQDRFQELLQPHMSVILRTVQTQMRNHAEVDDVIQETLLKALTRLTQFRFEASFRTWLVQIAINESRQWYRRRMSIQTGPLSESNNSSTHHLLRLRSASGRNQVEVCIAHSPNFRRSIKMLYASETCISSASRKLPGYFD